MKTQLSKKDYFNSSGERNVLVHTFSKEAFLVFMKFSGNSKPR